MNNVSRVQVLQCQQNLHKTIKKLVLHVAHKQSEKQLSVCMNYVYSGADLEHTYKTLFQLLVFTHCWIQIDATKSNKCIYFTARENERGNETNENRQTDKQTENRT